MKRIGLLLVYLIACHIMVAGQTADWNLNPYFANFLAEKPDSVVKSFFYKANTRKKDVAITFDDGVIANTPELVNYLKANKIPATFFLIMRSVNQESLRLFDAPLFELGIHTWKHDDFRELTEAQKIADMDSCQQALIRLDARHRFANYRPAYGVIDATIAREISKRNWRGVLWSDESQDWNGLKGDTLVQNTLKNLDRGSIILFHDIISLADLSTICTAIREKGFRIVPLSKLLKRKTLFPPRTASR
ncbi:MAG TPA: hypothetical protein DCO78_06620 [Chitinophagaceae bacterium]|nr:hypothetical protein [Chitinophagaceae bacterium]